MAKKKIGIMTYWQSNDNYGQQLQHWALQRVLEQHNYRPFLIRYSYQLPCIGECSKLRYIKRWIKRELKPYRDSINMKNMISRKFPLFRLLHIHTSRRIYRSIEDLMSHPPKADVYLTGSDQVWNYDLSENDLRASYLQFGENEICRIAYAPSVGHTTIPLEWQTIFQKYLQRFSAISVREQSASKLYSEMGIHAPVVCDPTLLLTKPDYQILTKYSKNNKSVFIYSLNYNSVYDLPYNEIQNYAKEKELPIVVIPSSGYLPAKQLFKDVDYLFATIPEWINTIAQSEIVITASFHGIIFCLLFHKSFIYTPLEGSYASSNCRVLDLLSALGLEERVWKRNISIEPILSAQIDWKSVDDKIDTFRKESLGFLLSALEQCQKE